jgi:hypothetical protein
MAIFRSGCLFIQCSMHRVRETSDALEIEANSKKYLRRVEIVLGIKDCEHPLVQATKEVFQRLLEVDLTMVIVRLEVFKKVDENVRVPLVDDAIRLLEESMKLEL